MKTNADKYLKEGVSIEEFAFEISNLIVNGYRAGKNKKEYWPLNEVEKWLEKQAIIPTLTEDERVILKNIDTRRYPTIKRTKIGEIIVISNAKYGDDIICYLYCYDHLFQFIKERRRI